jgi:multimeric flavodoxin WrbA
MKIKIIGLAGSLRNIIQKNRAKLLKEDLKSIADLNTLFEYLKSASTISKNTRFHFSDTSIQANKFKLLHHFKTEKTIKGMSNSEVALATALWAAWQKQVNFEYVSLHDYFQASKKRKDIDKLKTKLVSADAILLSGPVYFGDRGSLIQELIDVLKRDNSLSDILHGKLFGGISVGAKRNGGQETTLIYQILDMTSLGFIAVGNDSETTSQYGGTCVAGDIGSIIRDEYGINTAMGVGRRLANLLIKYSHSGELVDKPQILFIILQDELSGFSRAYVERLIKANSKRMAAKVIDVSNKKLFNCLACDTCPNKIDFDDVYRCKIGTADDFYKIHNQIMDHDAIVPVAVSMIDYKKIRTNYQTFLERTRYLRRGDYFFSDIMVAPLIFQEVGSMENLHIRMITSFIRHHTVVSKPIIGYLDKGIVLNESAVSKDFDFFIHDASRLAIARLTDALKGGHFTQYNPVGYVVSPSKSHEDSLKKRQMIVSERQKRLKAIAKKRIRNY